MMDALPRSMPLQLTRYTEILEIVGDVLKVRVPDSGIVRLGDLALLRTSDGGERLAQTIAIDREIVSLQVFSGTKGISTRATVTFTGHPMRTAYSVNSLGRVFDGLSNPVDRGPDLSMENRIAIGGPR